MWFDLHLETARYDAEDRDAGSDADDDDSLDNWQSKGVWLNYGSCTLSSIQWDNGGFKVGTGDLPFDFEASVGRTFEVDPLPLDEEGLPSFGIYLQGHDTAADHRISFDKADGENLWSIGWQGRIALTYLGGREFLHQFRALVEGTAFDGIEMPPGITREQAGPLLARFVARPDLFELAEVGEQLVFKFT